MAAFFFDIDGTLVKYHTNEWLPGAKEMLERLNMEGHTIILMTMRGTQDKDKEWSVGNTQKLLATLDIDFYDVVYRVQSPRIFIDDRSNSLVHHPKDKPWDECKVKLPVAF